MEQAFRYVAHRASMPARNVSLQRNAMPRLCKILILTQSERRQWPNSWHCVIYKLLISSESETWSQIMQLTHWGSSCCGRSPCKHKSQSNSVATNPKDVMKNLYPDVADRTSQKEFEVTSLTYCVFFVWLQADLLAVSFWSLAVQHNLLCRVHVEAVVLPRFMRSLH